MELVFFKKSKLIFLSSKNLDIDNMQIYSRTKFELQIRIILG